MSPCSSLAEWPMVWVCLQHTSSGPSTWSTPWRMTASATSSLTVSFTVPSGPRGRVARALAGLLEAHRHRQGDDITVRRAARVSIDLSDLLLAVEVASPSNPRLDYHVKRDLYLREGVGEYWIINPDARNVSRWRGRGDSGEILSERVEWNIAGAPRPFVLALEELFYRSISLTYSL